MDRRTKLTLIYLGGIVVLLVGCALALSSKSTWAAPAGCAVTIIGAVVTILVPPLDE